MFVDDRIRVAERVARFQWGARLQLVFDTQPYVNVSSARDTRRHTHLSEITRAEKRLKERIHVTSCTLILQANIASFFL